MAIWQSNHLISAQHTPRHRPAHRMVPRRTRLRRCIGLLIIAAGLWLAGPPGP